MSRGLKRTVVNLYLISLVVSILERPQASIAAIFGQSAGYFYDSQSGIGEVSFLNQFNWSEFEAGNEKPEKDWSSLIREQNFRLERKCFRESYNLRCD